MNDTIITVENLGKKYSIHHQREGRQYVALRDVIARKATAPIRWLRRQHGAWSNGHGATNNGNGSCPPSPVVGKFPTEEFWALRDVSFEVKRGEVVGIIGRNGAGKSTLLKILSRITEPTEGRVRIRGRVASLLEVGTGFHPELTGRENIFVNGAILGMTRAEVQGKFDEIVAFAEIEKFLDTPVKRYSSGMYVRLAFAVAAHLEPEILLVDEVLAVGDSAFQKKCLGKMEDVALRQGRTILFVSHNMAAVQALCGSGLLLHSGRLHFDGCTVDAIRRYVESESGAVQVGRRTLSQSILLTRLDVVPSVVHRHEPTLFDLELQTSEDEIITDLALLIHGPSGDRAALIDLRSETGPYRLRRGSRLVIRTKVAAMPFVEADFSVGVYINAHSVCHSFMDLVKLTVLPCEDMGTIVPRDPQYRGLVDLCSEVKTELFDRNFVHTAD